VAAQLPLLIYGDERFDEHFCFSTGTFESFLAGAVRVKIQLPQGSRRLLRLSSLFLDGVPHPVLSEVHWVRKPEVTHECESLLRESFETT
jgi:hypothetical protein